MTIRHNEPTVQFLVEARLRGTTTVVDRFTIEQSKGTRKSESQESALYNTVQTYLNFLSIRNKLDYKIIRWGEVQDRSTWLRGDALDG